MSTDGDLGTVCDDSLDRLEDGSLLASSLLNGLHSLVGSLVSLSHDYLFLKEVVVACKTYISVESLQEPQTVV